MSEQIQKKKKKVEISIDVSKTFDVSLDSDKARELDTTLDIEAARYKARKGQAGTRTTGGGPYGCSESSCWVCKGST